MGAVILRSKNEEIAKRLLQVHINIEKQVKTPAWGALMEIDGSTLGVPRLSRLVLTRVNLFLQFNWIILNPKKHKPGPQNKNTLPRFNQSYNISSIIES